MRFHHTRQNGLTLIETLVASAIFVVFSLAIYQLYGTVFSLSSRIRVRTVLTEVAGEQFEFIRNLAYSNIGTVEGIPAGIVEQTQVLTRNGMTIEVQTTIRSIDDPADGTLAGIPGDLSPADKKLVELEVSCTSCIDPLATTYTSVIAPKNLETENGNGAIVIRAIDASGQPLAGAQVHITNDALAPTVDISDETGVTGVLTIVDAPPSAQNYKIVVTKEGYSSEETYLPGDAANPNPLKPHLTVAANAISQGTFVIDRTSRFSVVTQSPQCAAIGSISGTLTGTKLIGTEPDVIKHVLSFSTSGAGTDAIEDIEWDTYALGISGSSYDIVGSNPIFPLVVPPDTDQTLTITLAPNDPNRLVVAVVDSAGLPLAAADVAIDGPSGAFSDTTNVGSVSQTDWSGGGGQAAMVDFDKFYSSGSIDYGGGALALAQSGTYLPSGSLTSSIIDLGAPATFQQLSWLPTVQQAGLGADPVRFQIATSETSDEFTVWTFLGPDGTDATYYTSSPSSISAVHDGHRYLRYKAFLSTEDPTKTPSITDIAVTYTAGCLPPGQVDFGNLSNGTYHVTVSKSGFQTTEKDITISADTYDTITLTP